MKAILLFTTLTSSVVIHGSLPNTAEFAGIFAMSGYIAYQILNKPKQGGPEIRSTSRTHSESEDGVTDNPELYGSSGLWLAPWALASIFFAKSCGRLLDLQTSTTSPTAQFSITRMGFYSLLPMTLQLLYSYTRSYARAATNNPPALLNKRRATLTGTMLGIATLSTAAWSLNKLGRGH